MSLVVRDADVRAERSAIIELLTSELEGWADASKYDWLYLDNPHGGARCWVLEDENGKLAGVSAAFPRVLRYRTRELRAWVLGDFCVSRSFRTLGPAIRLQRAAFAAVDHGDVDLCYDFPSESMMAVYQRMGAHQRGELVRMVYLLKADRAVDQRVGNRALAKGLSAAGNTLLATRAALTKRDRSIDVTRGKAAFEAATDAGFGLEDGVTLSRTAEYLNWRYLENPNGPESVLSAAGRGGAAIVYHATDDDVEIVDVFGVNDVSTLRELVLAVVDDARERGATSVSTAHSAEHPWMDALDDLGFHRRGSGPFVVYARSGVIADSVPWFLARGDRDVY